MKDNIMFVIGLLGLAFFVALFKASTYKEPYYSIFNFFVGLYEGFRCWLSHRRHHIDVGSGFQLCQICDAHLLEELIKGIE